MISAQEKSSIGVPPVAARSHENTGETPALLETPVLQYFNPYGGLSISARNLPHWEQQDAIYFITFRLADSLPKGKLVQWQEERHQWLKAHPEPLSEDDQEEYSKQFPERLNQWLDAGAGACILKQQEVGEIVATALNYFNGQRYNLYDFVVMPNHVHLLVQPISGNNLSKIMHSWKSFTAHEITKHLNQAGMIWQDESYDHLVRNEEEYLHFRRYIANNPEKAGLSFGVISHSTVG